MNEQGPTGPDKPKQVFYAHSDPENPGVLPENNLSGGLSYGTI